MLKLEKCTKKFKKTTALNEFSCELGHGVYGLLGPNGSGKTTLMRCICGLVALDSGRIDCGAQSIGYLPQQFGVMKQLTVYEMLEYFAILKEIPKESRDREIRRCVELVNLSDKINEKTGSLSGGMIRRTGIAQAILGNPEIILFDEPTAGLDPEERVRFKNLIKQLKKDRTVIISTHIVSDVEAVCDNIAVINSGRNVCQGSGEELKAKARGKAYLVNEKYENELSADCFIKDRINGEDGNYLYVLSKNPVSFGIAAEPDIEDGYLCALKNI